MLRLSSEFQILQCSVRVWYIFSGSSSDAFKFIIRLLSYKHQQQQRRGGLSVANEMKIYGCVNFHSKRRADNLRASDREHKKTFQNLIDEMQIYEQKKFVIHYPADVNLGAR
jgi:hypothetical protein